MGLLLDIGKKLFLKFPGKLWNGYSSASHCHYHIIGQVIATGNECITFVLRIHHHFSQKMSLKRGQFSTIVFKTFPFTISPFRRWITPGPGELPRELPEEKVDPSGFRIVRRRGLSGHLLPGPPIGGHDVEPPGKRNSVWIPLWYFYILGPKLLLAMGCVKSGN